jgi:hypothetical protein
MPTAEGGFVPNADGTVSGGRRTNATGNQGGSYSADTSYGNGSLQREVDATGKNGNSYTADVTGTKGEGVSRTATCYDANGAVIACKP